MFLSLCMILRNEEAVLARCLDSVRKGVDEIILVDTGSRDRTKEIARAYTDQVYEFPWQDDFSAARNFGLEKASGDYWMWLDADDVLSETALFQLQRFKQQIPIETDVVMMPYGNAFDPRGRPGLLYERERILRNHPKYRFQGRVHEAVPPSGKIIRENILIEHRPQGKKDPDRNLRIYEKMLEQKAVFSPRDLYYYGRELMQHQRYLDAEKIFSGFLEASEGREEDRAEAARLRGRCFEILGEPVKAGRVLMQALLYGVPSGETCCAIGDYFMRKKQYPQAVWWFREALRAEKPLTAGAFIREECYGYLPAMNLCVCYDRMGDPETAEKYNELAGGFKPDDPAYQYNVAYFQRRHIV